jgi:hypothetical protein
MGQRFVRYHGAEMHEQFCASNVPRQFNFQQGCGTLSDVAQASIGTYRDSRKCSLVAESKHANACTQATFYAEPVQCQELHDRKGIRSYNFQQ